jgi:pimeloyl-ACP methyl ester carboxylesterase
VLFASLNSGYKSVSLPMQNIILLHGALGSAADLEPLGAALKKCGCTIHTFSFSGHGGTAFGNSFGIAQFAAELENFIQTKGLNDPTIFGYSMGGFVALYLASTQPGLIKNIITLGTKFNWSAETVAKETGLLDPGVMLQKIPAYAASLETKHGADWKETVTKTAALMKEIGDKQFLDPEILKTINTPVLIGIGDKDKMVTLDETLTVFKTLPDASMYMLPNSKHPIETANVNLLSAMILESIKG